MKAILVFIDGTICDTRQRHALGIGSPDFHKHEAILADRPDPGSVECLQTLAQSFHIVYIGARPTSALAATQEWLGQAGFPSGPVHLRESQSERLATVRDLRMQHEFVAGIGDRWDDNELHCELGVQSVIVKEYEGDWTNVSARIFETYRQQRVRENELRLDGKVEGLARVCPLLVAQYGSSIWDAWLDAVLKMAEDTREARRQEDLKLFEQYGLDPNDLRDAAKLDQINREDRWEENPVYGLQDFETVETTRSRYAFKVTRCRYAELWKKHGRPDIGYEIHCRTDMAWWDRPAWNEAVRFEQPSTIMAGDDFCLFVQYMSTAK